MTNNPINTTRKYTDKEQIFKYLPIEEKVEIKVEYFNYEPMFMMMRSGKMKAIISHDTEYGEKLEVNECTKYGSTIASIPLDKNVKEMYLECVGVMKELWVTYLNGVQMHIIIYRRI